MTTTTTEQVTNQWQEYADSSLGDTAVTVQNYDITRLSVAIDANPPSATDLGLYIAGEDKELYAGFEGKLWLRYPLLKDGESKDVGVMKG
ncbi:hypothetical protein QKW35_20615 [Pontibacterium granulatum]|uniref:hypothetical protein n=1 Tax=Pontibacterium granulatum TaxID=2036029 RepID=UPI00249A5E68|nr:hypothetical protein [Pontibacterium granulatum]MDI3326787.1 hypothetical protein [Pontibacterium granulatum]